MIDCSDLLRASIPNRYASLPRQQRRALQRRDAERIEKNLRRLGK